MQYEPQTRRSPPGATAGFKSADLDGQRTNCTTVPLAASTLATHRRLVPFAKEIADILATGRHPNVYAFAGTGAWDRANRRRRRHGPGTAAVIPADAEPEALRWPAGMDAVLLVAADLDRTAVLRIARAIVSAGVRCVACDGFIVRTAPPGGAA